MKQRAPDFTNTNRPATRHPGCKLSSRHTHTKIKRPSCSYQLLRTLETVGSYIHDQPLFFSILLFKPPFWCHHCFWIKSLNHPCLYSHPSQSHTSFWLNISLEALQRSIIRNWKLFALEMNNLLRDRGKYWQLKSFGWLARVRMTLPQVLLSRCKCRHRNKLDAIYCVQEGPQVDIKQTLSKTIWNNFCH